MGALTINWVEENYTKREVMIPMRDGNSLYTAIYEPKVHGTCSTGGAPAGLTGRSADGAGRSTDGAGRSTDGAGRSSSALKPPILLLRTPFPLKPYGEGRMASNLRESLANYARAGYIIVQQNVRGTYLSEGNFVNVPPLRQEGTGMLIETSEMTDTYDTVDWLLENTDSNGKVGVKGMSYPGFYATCASICGHPAIKAVSPQAPVTDWFMGDDLHHNGALMLSDTYHFGRFFFRKRPHPTSRILPTIQENHKDVYKFFLKKGPISRILGPLAARREFFRDIVTHPNYDYFWQERNAAPALEQPMERYPAMLIVGGTFDAEDGYGPLQCFARICNRDNAYLVLGPWAHGAWNHFDFDHLADSSLGSGLSEYYLDSIEYPFFAYYLEGVTEGAEQLLAPFDKVRIFPSEAVSYENRPKRSRWKNPITETLSISSDVWPLSATHPVKLYLTDGRKLSTRLPSAQSAAPDSGASVGTTAGASAGTTAVSSAEASAGTAAGTSVGTAAVSSAGASAGTASAALTYTSNPLRPVPAVEPSPYISKHYMAADQRFASRRKDVLTFRGPKSKGTMVICGPVKVSLNVKLSSTDADMVVKLIDVRSDGYQMLVRGDVMPMRFRKSFEKPQAVKPGEPTLVQFTMNDVYHVLKPGHKLMVQVQSSWYPLFAMSPQKFLKNPYLAEAKDYTSCDVTILPGDSYVELQVL